jgi:hypothetical protein
VPPVIFVLPLPAETTVTLTVKLPADIERDFEIHCRRHRLTKSEVVTRLLAQYLALQTPRKTTRQVAKEVGLLKGFTGPADLAANRKRYLREALRAKQSR